MHNNVIVKQRFNAPADKVWNAITDKDLMKEWYFDIPDFELKEHHQFNFYEPGNEHKFHHQGEILEIVPGKKLKYSWTYPEISKDKTLVKWELEEDQEGTLMTLTHKGLENFDHLGVDFSRDSFESGWKDLVETSLKEFVEK